MSTPSEAQLAKLRLRMDAIRSRGRRHFIVWRGILGFGLPWGISMAAFAYFASTDAFFAPFVSRAVPRWLGWLLYILPFGFLAGALWGVWMWRTFERKNWFVPPNAGDGPSPA